MLRLQPDLGIQGFGVYELEVCKLEENTGVVVAVEQLENGSEEAHQGERTRSEESC